MKKSRRFGNFNKYLEIFKKMTIEERDLMIKYLKDEQKYHREIQDLLHKVNSRPLLQYTYTPFTFLDSKKVRNLRKVRK